MPEWHYRVILQRNLTSLSNNVIDVKLETGQKVVVFHYSTDISLLLTRFQFFFVHKSSRPQSAVLISQLCRHQDLFTIMRSLHLQRTKHHFSFDTMMLTPYALPLIVRSFPQASASWSPALWQTTLTTKLLKIPSVPLTTKHLSLRPTQGWTDKSTETQRGIWYKSWAISEERI